MKHHLILTLCTLAMPFFMTSCFLPRLAELEGIPSYSTVPLQCEREVKVGVTVSPEYSGSIDYMTVVQGKSAPQTVVLPEAELAQIVTAALEPMRCKIPDHHNYITRRLRLSLERVAVVNVAQIRYLPAREGNVLDVRLDMSIHETGKREPLGATSAWGRHVSASKSELPDAVAAVREAAKHLATLPETKAMFVDTEQRGSQSAGSSETSGTTP